MQTNDNKPIFFDPTNKRWWRVKYSFLAIALFLLALFIIFFYFVYKELPLKSLSLPNNYNLSYVNPKVESSYITSIAKSQSKSQQQPDVTSASNVAYHLKTMAFLDNTMSGLGSFKQHLNNIDVVFGGWLNVVSSDGSIAEEVPQIEKLTKEYIIAYKPNTQIIPVLSNYTENNQETMTDKILTSTVTSQKIIQFLLDYVLTHHHNGIAIDFNDLAAHNKNDFTRFIYELATVFHQHHLLVFVEVPPNDLSYDYKTLAQAADYEIITAYDDEHWSNGTPGPIASFPWFKDIITQRTAEIPPAKMIISLGNFGYDWQDSNKGAEFKNFQQIMLSAKLASATINFDPTTLNPYFSYQDTTKNLHHVWFLDAVTAFNEITILKSLQLSGILLWNIGGEDPTIWNILASKDHNAENIARNLSTIPASNVIFSPNNETTGDLITMKHIPEIGKRQIVFDPITKMITFEYYKIFPSSYLISRYGKNQTKKVALTFDDGPSDYTLPILDILKTTHTPATFFVIGINALRNGDILERESLEGNEIGNHTFTHPDISKIGNTQFQFELATTQWLIEWLTNKRTYLFRPPYGIDRAPQSQADAKLLATLSKIGYITVVFNIDPADYLLPGVDKIVENVISQIDSNQSYVIIMHDGGGDRTQTVAALPLIISQLKQQGYEFVTISDLLTPNLQLMPRVRFTWALFLVGQIFRLFNFMINALLFTFVFIIVLGIARFIIFMIFSIIQKNREKPQSPLLDNFSVAVIVPVYNEGKVIVKTIKALLQAKHPKSFKIVIVNDGSSDNTLQLLHENFASNPIISILTQANTGKNAALQNGIRHSDSDIIITMDGDTFIMQDTILQLIQPFTDARVGAVAGNVKVGNQGNYLTRWQALEYCSIQNLERRVMEFVDAITVVPGAIGAWRRTAMLKAGGFTGDTMAEDADLTIKLKKLGYKISFVNNAIGYTEAPDTIRGLIRQRFRWMFGILQVIWKHKSVVLQPQHTALTFIAYPNTLIFQIIFPLISPLIDLLCLFSIFFILLNWSYHPTAPFPVDLVYIIAGYIFFTLTDIAAAIAALLLDGKEKLSLAFSVIPQRFFYRQLLSYVSIKIFIAALRGKQVWWGRNVRKASVKVENIGFIND